MKAAWVIVSTLALANLMALVGFMGWLGASGRLSLERVEAVRAIFVPTVAAEAAAKEEAEKQAKGATEGAPKAEETPAALPAPAAERIRVAADEAEAKRQAKLRLDRDLKSLQTFLVRENERLQKWEQDLRDRQTAFEAEQKRAVETQGTEQFKKALATLAGVKPKEAQAILSVLLAQEKRDEVVSYLDAMDERARSKVIAEFNKVDPKVAAELLEGLRVRGIASALPVRPGEPNP